MSDLIERQAAIDAICKVCSIVGDYQKCDGYPETSTWCDELVALRALPPAQPQEIIRCKDCKNFINAHSEAVGECTFHNDAFLPNDFCSYAERREESKDEQGMLR